MRNEDLQDLVSKALRRAWQLGQTYWQQADSDSVSQHKKADVTQARFDELIEETRSAVMPGPVELPLPECWYDLNDVGEPEVEWNRIKPQYPGNWRPLFTEQQVREILAQAAKEPTE